MTYFKPKLLVTIAIIAAAVVASPAQAKKIPYLTPGQLKNSCVAAQGDYNAPAGSGVYSCQLRGGAMIACGGRGEFARTCESMGPGKTILNPILIRGGDSAAGYELSEPKLSDAIFH